MLLSLLGEAISVSFSSEKYIFIVYVSKFKHVYENGLYSGAFQIIHS